MQIPVEILNKLNVKTRHTAESLIKMETAYRMLMESVTELGLTWSSVKHLVNPGGVDVTQRVKALNQPPASPKKKRQEIARRKNALKEEDYFDEIKKIIRAANGWASQRHIGDAASISVQPVRRVLKAMKRKGLIRMVRKSNNPSHADLRAKNCEHSYWELV